MYVEVAVNAPTPQHKSFSYSLPQGMDVSAGQAVWVPFGSRLLQGIVLDVTDHPQVAETRDVHSLITDQSVLSPVQLELARWISDYYLAPIFDCASMMMPPGWRQSADTVLRLVDKRATELWQELDGSLRAVVECLAEVGEASLDVLKERLPKVKLPAAVNSLIAMGLLERQTVVRPPRIRPKTQRVLHLIEEEAGQRRLRSGKQQALAALLSQEGPMSVSEARRRLGVSPSTINSLASAGVVAVHQERVLRDPLAGRPVVESIRPELTSDQEKVWAEIRAAIQERNSGDGSATSRAKRPAPSFLLHGVTASGKTEVYIRALEETIAGGGRGIVLVPEIALTPQTVARFRSRFGDRVAVLHSGLTAGQQYDEWWRVKAGEFDVVIGSRSAIFAPQPDLGLIIIDEEHEAAYKQDDPQPRYHSREVALRLAGLAGAVAVLGSATPDVCTYHEALQGRHRLLKMPERITFAVSRPGAAVGPIENRPRALVVDMRRELREGNRSIFSRTLVRGLTAAVSLKQQAILFLNRRGSATFVQCRDCGFVARCRRCDTSLTYHSVGGNLLCHRCNNRTRPPTSCPSCGSHRIRFLGAGTQKVVEEVNALLPQARVIRWDRDVTKNFKAHEEVLRKFAEHEADVLVGTQMIAKGLDIPRVTLVGVVNADLSLHVPDFRSPERTFQLLTQVSGRAGRGPQGGMVVIQTYDPEHYAINTASRQSYEDFFQLETAFRRSHGYPPFAPLAKLSISHYVAQRAEEEALRLKGLLERERRSLGLSDIRIMGPVPSYIMKVRGSYRWQMLLLGEDYRSLLDRVPVPQGWTVDIDPQNLL